MNADEKKKKIIMLFIALGLILSVIFGVTFSYLAPSINNVESNSTVAFNAGTIAINYENGQNQINASEVLPGWTSIKEFSLTAINNTTISTSGAMNYAIKLIVEKNTFNDGTITYSIEGENVNNNGTIAYVLPNSLKKGASEVILGYGVFDTSSDISKGVTHRYTLTMAFPNKTYESQNEDSGKTLSAHIIIANEGESTFSNLTIIDDINNLNKTMILKNDTAYELPNIASKAGAYFLGWNVESGNATINGNKITINGNASIKANYSSTNKTEFAYTGKEQIFTAPVAGKYKLETWGAQGGSICSNSNCDILETNVYGGYGGYSVGHTMLNANDVLYVNVGGAGSNIASVNSSSIGGYNGGADSLSNSNTRWGGGGGATHVAVISGELKDIGLSNINKILVAAGGGGGGGQFNTYYNIGGSGGGYIGNTGNGNAPGSGGTQSAGGNGGGTKNIINGSFGLGGGSLSNNASGGGGGLYGGGTGYHYGSGAGGGSGYIGNSILTDKYMYCYNCTTSDVESTKTYTTTCAEETPTENCAKKGNGYVRITMEIKEGIDLSTITVVSEELKKVITIEAEKGEETEISVEGLTNSSLGFKSFEIEKGEATINKTKITPLSNTIVVRIIYKQIFNWEFAYTGEEQIFTVPVTGTYKLETWGAQGGNSTLYSGARGGYGGYSVGNIYLSKNDILYINVGGKGVDGDNSSSTKTGGYNGGGDKITPDSAYYSSSGGGATHIATESGELSNLSSYAGNNDSPILIVAGGGGGGAGTSDNYGAGGDGGGIVGMRGTNVKGKTGWGAGGTQTTAGCQNTSTTSLCGTFGKGNFTSSGHGGAGGGGYYGGGGTNTGYIGGGGGGSGYIGNNLLTDKYMYCYNSRTSDVESTKTYTTKCAEETPTENCAKNGNGFARITLIS